MSKLIELERVQFSVKWNFDEYEDSSYIRTFTDEYSDGVIERNPDSRFGRYARFGEYRYFKPEITEQEHFDMLRKDMKGSRHEYSVKRARELARLYVEQDHQRLESLNKGYWTFMECYVTVKLDNHVIGSASLGGVESDIDQAYRDEIITELKLETYRDASNYLMRLESALSLPDVHAIEAIERH